MGHTTDLLRSFLRSAVNRTGDSLGARDFAHRVQQTITELKRQRILVPDADITAAIVREAPAASAMVHCHDGRVHIDATFEDSKPLHVHLCPKAIHFAPRGAKEIVFQVDFVDKEQIHHRHLSDVVSVLGGVIAEALWSIVLRPTNNPLPLKGAFVDRESDTLLRVDLRTVPKIRAIQPHGTAGTLLDILALAAIKPNDGALGLQLSMPSFLGKR